MTNKHIARVLKETAALLELTGGNPFRSRAFDNAARTIERMEESVTDLLAEGTLTEVRGIGAGLAAQITELLATGSFDVRDELLAQLPPGLLQVLRVKGLGAKKVRQIWQVLGITTIDELEAAAEAGHLAELEGFGRKTQENILASIRLLRQYQGRRRYADAYLLTLPLLERLREAPGVERAELSGAMRRKRETVEAADLLVAGGTAADVAALLDDLTSQDARVETDGARVEATLADGFAFRIRVAEPAHFGTTWWEETGSAAHCAAFRAAHGEPGAHRDEREVYAAAGLPFIEPELREGQGELEAAAAGRLPDLIRPESLRGTLHNHTTYSDGAHTLAQMAEAARGMGLSYLGICDHSRSLTIANGLSIERVREQQAEIRSLNEAFAREGAAFRIFSGTECDILADGSLDYPEDVLASFDFVVASIHTGFNMTVEEATERLLRAIENPFTTILGHATGRLLLSREGYPVDHERVIAACAAHGVSIELNANPYRLDMDWRWLRRAAEQGVLISINPDAHAVEELHNTRWGVEVARKAWLTPAQCLNALPLEAFTEWLARRAATRPA